MRNLLVLASVAFIAAASGLGCAGQAAEPAPEETVATGQGELTITEDADYDLAGTWSYAGHVIQFESHVTEEGVATVKLLVNGAAFDTKFDYFTHAWEADGHKNTLFRPEIDALVKLEKHLDSIGKQGRPWQRLYASVAQHGAAPAGHTFLARAGSPTTVAEKQHREYNSVGNNGVTYICRGTSGRNFSNNWDYQWAEHDSFGGEGGDSRNATSGNYYHEKMWSLTPGGCTVGWYGPRNDGSGKKGSCEGRCGSGCPRTYNYYFTNDCLDHDSCLNYHPAAPGVSYSGDCGYEFSDADGDFAGGTSAGYYWGCPGTFGSGCPDNGNSQGAGG